MKKYLPYILIAVVVMGVFGPLNTQKADATDATGEWEKPSTISSSNCIPIPGFGFDFTKCVAFVSFNVIFRPTSAILWFSGQILNGSVDYSLDGETFSSGMISNGWKTTRDFANLFFIFILLYIAIATILQLSGYGMKDLLVKIIIIALLVNFSLLICHVIIDASNILALEFYNKMTVKAGENSITAALFGKNAKDISAVFVAGFDPQKISSTKMFDKWQDAGGEDIGVIVIFILGSLMNIVGAFVLFAGALLFVIRIAILWLIMMLAPLAFLAMILPATNQYAKQWWDKLFNQAFFAPAFLFLFYLVAKLVAGDPDTGQKGVLEEMFTSLALNTTNQSGLKGLFASLTTILIYFTVMAVLMVACLIVAKQMGAYGAGTVMKWGQSAKKWGQGYAGRVGKRYVGRAATAVEGALEKERESKIGRGFAKTLKAVPFLQRGVAGAAQLKKKEVGKYEKQYAGYDAGTLEQLKGKVGTTPEAREAMGKLITKKRAQEAKKEDISKENVRHKAIIGTEEKNYKDGELPRTEKELVFMAPEGYVERYAKIESRIETLRGEKTTEAEQERTELIVKKEKLQEIRKKIDQLETEKKKIEENRARRSEIEGLEEEIAKVKAGVEGAKKPKEAGPEKT